MSDADAAGRPPITDSPWFWLCLFATMGLVALAAIGPKYAKRQAGIERKEQARQRAAELASGGTAQTPVSTEDDLVVSLKPLLLIVGAIVVAAWTILWWQYLRPPARRQAEVGRGPT
jgi:cell division protein FtsL